MPDHIFYEDPELRITAVEIRSQKQTIQTSSVTAVRFASVRPGKWLPVIALVPLVGVALAYSQAQATRPVNPLLFMSLVLPIIPVIVLSFVRISRLIVQTAAGPVMLVNKIQLTDPAATLARLQTIKESIEQALRAGQFP